jgi:hypothetical protein
MDFTKIFEAVITLVTLLITAFVIPWLKRKIGAEKLAEVKEWANIAVAAAEQLYSGDGCGAEKQKYVLNFLKDKGITVDPNSLKNIIEAAVYDLPRLIL